MNFSFIPLQESDLQMLFHWFQEPHIRQWWKEPQDWNIFLKKFIEKLADLDTIRFIISANHVPIGYIHYYDAHKVPDTFGNIDPAGTYGIDFFIGNPEYIGKGYGPILLKQFTDTLFKEHAQIKSIIVDPAQANIRAIRCYEKVGFKKVKEIKTPDGEILVPGILMELLRKNHIPEKKLS